MPEYTKNKQNSVVRKRDRGHYDYQTVHNIIETAPVLHVSFIPPPADGGAEGEEDAAFPVVLPMIGCTGSFENRYTEDDDAEAMNKPRDLYLHGYVSARMMKLPAGSRGMPVSCCATFVDGLVLALTPFNHSYNYRSSIVHGYATVVTDHDEKMYAMERVTNKVVPQRWDNCRTPPTKAENDSTAILKVTISTASAKIRGGGAGDDRHDMKDEAMRQRVWTGVVPCWTQYGDPVSADYNLVKHVPSYLDEYLHEANVQGKKKAYDTMQKK